MELLKNAHKCLKIERAFGIFHVKIVSVSTVEQKFGLRVKHLFPIILIDLFINLTF